MGIEQKQCWSVLLNINIGLKLRFWCNITSVLRGIVIARMPEDRSKTIKNRQTPSKPYTPVCVHL
eukprot:5159173-Heterocapsa_arctica.AAC.1